MSFTPIETLLPAALSVDDRARAIHALAQTRIAIGHALEWTSIFRALDWPQNTTLICDNSTWEALAKTMSAALSTSGYRITLLNIGSAPEPTDVLAKYIASHAADCDALIAVGSGVINDLTQYAAHMLQKPYAICGTAASMNGYLSANAAIMARGHKKTLPATLPAAALFDLDVLEAAPARLKQAGLGDSICRSTAQADWLLSHHLLGTKYDPLPFALLAPFEVAVLEGDMQALITTLLLSGLGMTLAGGSYPASQGEHLLSHYMEMRFPDIAHKWLHGQQIAVTTLYMAALQERLLAALPTLPPRMDRTLVIAHFGETSGVEVWKEYHAKCESVGNVQISEDKWSAIQAELAKITLPKTSIQQALTKAGAPTTPEQLGLSVVQWRETVRYAPLIRNRFTFLDLA